MIVDRIVHTAFFGDWSFFEKPAKKQKLWTSSFIGNLLERNVSYKNFRNHCIFVALKLSIKSLAMVCSICKHSCHWLAAKRSSISFVFFNVRSQKKKATISQLVNDLTMTRSRGHWPIKFTVDTLSMNRSNWWRWPSKSKFYPKSIDVRFLGLLIPLTPIQAGFIIRSDKIWNSSCQETGPMNIDYILPR